MMQLNARRRRSWKRRKRSQGLPSYKRPAVIKESYVSPRTALGNRAWTKMIFAVKGQFGGGLAGAATSVQFRANSINECRVGLAGQPTGHDQMSALFEKYCVVSCSYKITFINFSTTNTNICAIQITDSSSTTTDMSLLLSQGQVEFKPIVTLNGGNSSCEFTGYINNPKVMGVSRKNYLDESAYQAQFGSNPSDVSFLNIYNADSGTGTAATLNYTVVIEYNVLLFGGTLVPAS